MSGRLLSENYIFLLELFYSFESLTRTFFLSLSQKKPCIHGGFFDVLNNHYESDESGMNVAIPLHAERFPGNNDAPQQ